MKQPIHVSLVMGVASGMPCKPNWVDVRVRPARPSSAFSCARALTMPHRAQLLKDEISPETHWQTIAIGRADQAQTARRPAATARAPRRASEPLSRPVPRL